MKRFSATVLALAVLALGSSAQILAHENHEHKVMGTVTMAAADHVTLKVSANGRRRRDNARHARDSA